MATRARNMFCEILGTVIGCMIALAIYGATGRVVLVASKLEDWISPVETIAASGIMRQDGLACFYLQLHKLVAAKPLTYLFSGQTRVATNAEWGAPMPLSAYLAKDDSTKRDGDGRLQQHGPGQSWRRHYCFEMPGTIADWQEIRIAGFAEHRRHPFYTSVTPIPEFRVPPMLHAERFVP